MGVYMVLDAVANFVRGETDAAVDDTQTTVSVADASIFPDPSADGEYNVVMWDASSFPRPDQDAGVEILRVTGRDTTADELTVARAQEGTAASAHPDGAALHLSPTAKMFSDIADTFTTTDDNVEGFATAGGEGTVPTSQGDGTLAMQEAGGEVTTVDPNEAVTNEEPSATGDGALAIAVAGNAVASGGDSIAIGNGSEAEQTGTVAIGNNATTGNGRSVAVGLGTTASGSSSYSLGRDATATAASAGAIGRGAEALNDNEGYLGGSGSFDTNDWIVPGDFSVEGSKNFEIDHPSKPDTHDLKHGAYEGPVPGGLIYSATVSADAERVNLTGHLPEYVTEGDFGTDWTCHVTASDHFGRGYVDAEEWVLVVEDPGDYEVTIFGARDDPGALKNGGDRVEKPKGERWNGEPRTYWRNCPHADADDYDDVLRVEAKFEHTPDCSPEPCEEAHVMCRVTFDDGERVEVPDADFKEPADRIVDKARELRE